MASQVKRFGEHSQRWQREARRQGVTPAKWNKWRRLSPASRKVSNPTDYSKGKTVVQFRTEKRDQAVFDSLNLAHKGKEKYRPRTVRKRVGEMSVAQKNKILSFKTTGQLRHYIYQQLRKVPKGADSIWFYQ